MKQLKVSGAMVGGLAHKIRNPLAAAKLSIEVLLSEDNIKGKDREVLSCVLEEIRRIELLTKGFLNFARPAATQFMTMNINNVLEETARFLEKRPAFSLPASNRKIIRELDADIPDMVGDPQQLQQAFLNILVNAAEATPEGGTVTLKTWFDAEAGTICVNLSDMGKGVPVELATQIFQPFFTTKVKGVGLGLAVAKRLIEDHGGGIMVTGDERTGATFSVILPRIAKPDKRN
jgi:signal transduction histidine kinase